MLTIATHYRLSIKSSSRTLFLSSPSAKRKSVLTEKMEIYSITKPKKRIDIGKSVVDKKGRYYAKELLSPL